MAHTPAFLARRTTGPAIYENLKLWETIIDQRVEAATTYEDLNVSLGVTKMLNGVFPLLQRKYVAAGWVDIRRRCDGSLVLVAPVMEEGDYIDPPKKKNRRRAR